MRRGQPLHRHAGCQARGFFIARQRLFQRFQQAAGLLLLVLLGVKVALERAR